LRSVADRITGAIVNSGTQRVECILDSAGRTLRWRIWVRLVDGTWRPASSWRGTSWNASHVLKRSAENHGRGA